MTRLLPPLLLLACTSTTTAPHGDVISSSGAWAPAAPDRVANLEDALVTARTEQDLSGLAMAVAWHAPPRLWVGTTGLADRQAGTPWTPELSSRIGSVTKTFTAALIHQLVQEDRVHLDDPLSTWLDTPWPDVTVRHLLGMSSGIASYNHVGGFDDTRAWTPRELVDWAAEVEPDLQFEPGTDWAYSNTNYVLLGLIAEAVLGTRYEDALADRFLEPLDLPSLELAGTGHRIDPLRSYDAEGNDLGAVDPSFGWAGGALVGAPGEVARWNDALFHGEVLPPAALDRMITPGGLTDPGEEPYGLGAFIGTDGTYTVVGHTGGIAGHLTYAFTLVEPPVTVVVMTHQLGVDMDRAAANAWAVVLGVD